MNKRNSICETKTPTLHGPVPLFLNKVNSDKKAIECANILEACHPTHSERLWLCGFLKFAGYSMTEVLDIIREHAQWTDYDGRTTAQQVASVFHQRPQQTQNRQTRQVRKWDLSPVEVLRIRRQKSISLSKTLCEESNAIEFPHPERLKIFNSWGEFLQK
jgi:hypothetical protein